MKILSGLAPLVVFASVCVPLAAHADDIVTLSYESELLSGTSTYLPTDLSDSAPSLPTAPYSGILLTTIVFDQTLANAALGAGIVSFDAVLYGSAGETNVSPGFFPLSGYGSCSAVDTSCVAITSSAGVVTGAEIDLTSDLYHYQFSSLAIGPSGDEVSYADDSAEGNCENQVYGYGPGYVYTGATVNPCSFTVSNTTAGKWTVTSASAPEIDPASAGSALTLLAGCLAVLRGRKRVAT